ncbi:MAG: hypothetical protein V4554_15020 [Pseudomonadota bacterium]
MNPMAAPGSRHRTRQIVIAMLASIVLGVVLNRLGTAPWLQAVRVAGLLYMVGSVFVIAVKMMTATHPSLLLPEPCFIR